MVEGTISLRAFARKRGVSLKAVQKAIASGRVHATAVERNAAGRITGIREAEATAQWNANTDPVEAARNGKLQASPQPNTSASEARPPEPATTAGSGGECDAAAAPASGGQAQYLEHRTKRELFEARTAELEYLEKVGLLVSASEVREVIFRIFRTFRDKMLNIPDRVSTVAAAEHDPVAVHKLFSDELKRVLDELSDGARLAAARGDP